MMQTRAVEQFDQIIDIQNALKNNSLYRRYQGKEI